MTMILTRREQMEEMLNAVTHGIGALLALIGLIVLIVAAYSHGNIWHRLSFSIYGTSLLLLYVASTLYHSFRNEKLKHIFRICDHASIYLLIAGTYTPFTLVLLRGSLGWTIFGVVWALALLGIVQQIFFVGRFKLFSTLCYLGLGWFIVAFIKPLAAALPLVGFCWLVGGGIAYTVGAMIYLCRRLSFHHTVWHFFVLAGSLCHFITVLYFLLPIQAAG